MGLERSQVEQGAQGQGMTFEQFVIAIAAAAKLNIQVKSPSLVLVPYNLGGGRLQNTFVSPLGATGAGNQIVGFFSPALKLNPGQELNQKTANSLLRRSALLAHGAWAIVNIEGADYLGVQDTQIAQSMQPGEFQASCLAVASAADEFEKEMGTDMF